MVNIQLKVTLNPIDANSFVEYYLENDCKSNLHFTKLMVAKYSIYQMECKQKEHTN